MKRVVLVTLHYLRSKRKAGFHWLADTYWRAGWDVVFFTCYVSPLTYIRGADWRLAYPLRAEGNRPVCVRERMCSYVWYTRWHPFNLRLGWLNRLSMPLFRRYGRGGLGDAEPLVREADLLIFESSPGLMLFERFKGLSPSGRFVYRMSDLLSFLGVHPVALEVERRVAPLFDLVSVPSEYILRRFEHLSNVRLDYHGVRKGLFDAESDNPYGGQWEVNAIFVGSSHLDRDFIERASRLMPRWGFHVIGPFDNLPRRRNVIAHGEIPFERTVPLVAHADVALNCLSYTPGAEAFTDSNKMIQYAYCRLPVVAPEFLRSRREGVLYYRPGDDESIRRALEEARGFDRTRVPRDTCRSWDELAADLAGELWRQPQR